MFVLDWPREQLGERIRRRVDEMFAAGLVEDGELRQLGNGEWGMGNDFRQPAMQRSEVRSTCRPLSRTAPRRSAIAK